MHADVVFIRRRSAVVDLRPGTLVIWGSNSNRTQFRSESRFGIDRERPRAGISNRITADDLRHPPRPSGRCLTEAGAGESKDTRGFVIPRRPKLMKPLPGGVRHLGKEDCGALKRLMRNGLRKCRLDRPCINSPKIEIVPTAPRSSVCNPSLCSSSVARLPCCSQLRLCSQPTKKGDAADNGKPSPSRCPTRNGSGGRRPCAKNSKGRTSSG